MCALVAGILSCCAVALANCSSARICPDVLLHPSVLLAVRGPRRRGPLQGRPPQAISDAKDKRPEESTVGELRQQLKALGLSVSGRKAVLLQRLSDFADGVLDPDTSGEPGQEAGTEPEPAPEMTVLKSELQRWGISDAGGKAELIERWRIAKAEEIVGRVDTWDEQRWVRVHAVTTLRPGQRCRGPVSSILPTVGAFVDVGVEHNALLRNSRMLSPPRVGEEVDVWVYRIRRNGELSLSTRETKWARKRDPLEGFMEVDDKLWFNATVHNVADSDVTVLVMADNIYDGEVEGVIQRSEIKAQDLEVGDVLYGRVINCDEENGYLRLTTLPHPEEPHEDGEGKQQARRLALDAERAVNSSSRHQRMPRELEALLNHALKK